MQIHYQCVHHENPPLYVEALFTLVRTIQCPVRMPLPTLPTPPAPQPNGFGELLERMQTADSDRPLGLAMETTSLDDEFNNLTFDIDVCTERFMQLQANMTDALDRYKGCRLVGMDAHVLGKLVLYSADIGLTIPQVEVLQQRLPDLHLIEKFNDMWEAIQAIEPHLDDLLHRDSEDMVKLVYDNTDENLPMTSLLEACQIAEPFHEEGGPVQPIIEERTIDDEFNYVASEIHEVTREFMRLQRTITTALQRYTSCLLLSDRIHHLCMVEIAAEHIGFDSQQKTYIESAIPELAYMEKITWQQSREIKPHLPNIFESMANINP
jgi:hypothetical protein